MTAFLHLGGPAAGTGTTFFVIVVFTAVAISFHSEIALRMVDHRRRKVTRREMQVRLDEERVKRLRTAGLCHNCGERLDVFSDRADEWLNNTGGHAA